MSYYVPEVSIGFLHFFPPVLWGIYCYFYFTDDQIGLTEHYAFPVTHQLRSQECGSFSLTFHNIPISFPLRGWVSKAEEPIVLNSPRTMTTWLLNVILIIEMKRCARRTRCMNHMFQWVSKVLSKVDVTAELLPFLEGDLRKGCWHLHRDFNGWVLYTLT